MKKIFKILSLILVLLSLLSVMPVYAVNELDGTNSSYVYDYWGNTVSTPLPYETDITVCKGNQYLKIAGENRSPRKVRLLL